MHSSTFLSFLILFICISFCSSSYRFITPTNGTQWIITREYEASWITAHDDNHDHPNDPDDSNDPDNFISLYLQRPNEQYQLSFYEPDTGEADIYLDLYLFQVTKQTRNDWQIRVENAQDETQFGLSQPFTIIYPQITVFGGDDWIIGSNTTVYWNTTGGNSIVDQVSILLIHNATQNQIWLAHSYPNTGSYTLTGVDPDWVTDSPYNLVIAWQDYAYEVYGASSPFYIVDPFINVSTIPSILTGAQLTVNWNASKVVASVSVWLQVPGMGLLPLCSNSNGTSCSLYPLPFWLLPSSAYRVTVCWDKYSWVCGNSNTFNVSGLVELDNSIVFQPIVTGASYNVSWSVKSPVSSFVLALYKKYTNFTEGTMVYQIYSGDKFGSSASHIWDVNLPAGTVVESGAIYFLRVDYLLSRDDIYGVTRNFRMINQSTVAPLRFDDHNTFYTSLAIGSKLEISWSSISDSVRNNTLPYVSLFLVRANQTVSTIAQNIYNTGSYWWDVPTNIAKNYYYNMKICYSAGVDSALKCQISRQFLITEKVSSNSLYILLGVGAGVLFLVGIIIGILVRKKCKKNTELKSFTENSPLVPSAPTDEHLCGICFNNPKNTGIIPCGHTICEDCSRHIDNLCPMCRRPIENFLRLF